MKKLILSLILVTAALGVQAGSDSKPAPAKDASCCAAKTDSCCAAKATAKAKTVHSPKATEQLAMK